MTGTGSYAPDRATGAPPAAHAEAGLPDRELAEELGFRANHVIAFEIPESIRFVRPRGGVAALNQPTAFSMARAVRRTGEVEVEPEVVAESYPELEWPSLDDFALEAELAPAESTGPPPPAEALVAPTPAPPALPQSHPLRASADSDLDLDIELDASSGPVSSPNGTELQFDDLPQPPPRVRPPVHPVGPSRQLGNVSTDEIKNRYSGTLLRTDKAASVPGVPALKRKRPPDPRVALGGAVLAGLVLLVALVVLEQNSAVSAADAIETDAATVLDPQRYLTSVLSTDTLATEVRAFCQERSLSCTDARVFVEVSSRPGWEAHHGRTFEVPASTEAYVFVRYGFETDIVATGWLWSTEERSLSTVAIHPLAPGLPKYGEAKLQ